MTGFRRLACRSAAALALLLAPALAHPVAAQIVSPDQQARASVQIARSGRIRNLEELNFGYLSVTTAGTAVVNPNTDALTTTGGVIYAGRLHYAALFEAVLPVKSVVIIRIPRQPITVTRVGGTETMTVSNWTLSGQSRRTVAEQEEFDFAVGGTLYVNANQAEGTYVGTFEVDIQYP